MNWDLQKQADSVKFDNLHQKDRYKIAKRTLDCLISYCDEDGDTTVSIETIYKRLQCCAQTVVNHFEILTDLSILTLQKQGRKMYKKIKFISSNEASNEASSKSSSKSSNEDSNEDSNVVEAKKEKKVKKESSSSDVVGKPPTTSIFLDNATTLANYLLESILEFQPTVK